VRVTFGKSRQTPQPAALAPAFSASRQRKKGGTWSVGEDFIIKSDIP
jgi:hypothetical protein